MKVLITGGAGFIGSSVSDRLLDLGHHVMIIDNYQTGTRENNLPHPNLRIVEGSITDEQVIKNSFTEFHPDIVLHTAASYKDPGNWEEDVATNLGGTLHVIRQSALNKVKRIIYLQTSLCYGLHPQESPVSIRHPLFSGGSSYAISKTSGEQYLELSGHEFVSLRLANVYGPRNLSGPLPAFFYRLSNDLRCVVVDSRRDFIFIDDVVNVIMKAIDGNGSKGYYHVSTGNDHSIKTLFELTVKHMGIRPGQNPEEVRVGDDDAHTILLDPSKTRADFAWQAETGLEEGVEKTIQWYRAHAPTQTFTHLKNIN